MTQTQEKASFRHDVTLDDKYTEKSGRIYLNGLQALLRILLMQRQLDTARSLKTGVFISGYRGSPLGGLDMTFASAKKLLDAQDIKFVPGINEDLGATAVWGSQQLNLGPGARYDGVVGVWYGKGPGVDRSADALKHANAAGSSKHGGVLALAGDDHACKSSTFPHQSEQAFVHCMIPVLHPAGIGDAMDLGLHGIALSRYSGCWTAFKVVSDFADSSASVFSNPFALQFQTPTDFDMPKDGLNIRWYDPPVAQEERLIKWKLPAAQAYARANKLDRMVIDPPQKRFAIVSTGKAWMDTMQALEDLGITQKRAEEMGIAVYKVALTWPMEPEGITRLAGQVDEIFVVEEKRGFMEDQIRRILYNMPADRRPRVTGKTDEKGAPLLPESYELWPALIAEALITRLRNLNDSTLASFRRKPESSCLPLAGNMPAAPESGCRIESGMTERGQFSDIPISSFEDRLHAARKSLEAKSKPSPVARTPYFCSGCPHNTSTVVPEGSRALAGIGCHYMAMWMDRSSVMFSQMGGEGVPWIGQAPFTDEKHVFVNLGDGTYFHSGLLAIRAAVAAKVNLTYKILYNDAVAMTGGQHVDGELTVPALAHQVYAEGVRGIIVMSDEPEKYGGTSSFPSGTRIEHRDHLDKIQKELREMPGCTVLIYDQTCAAEKRRRRKRGLMIDPPKRAFINERVCEGCGDCGVQSNCLSIAPVETEFGRKRQIDQSTCNKDFSCVKGFCPSFVTVHDGALRKPPSLPLPLAGEGRAGATAPAEGEGATYSLSQTPSPQPSPASGRGGDGAQISTPWDNLEYPVLPTLDHPTAMLVTGIGGTGIVTIGAILAMAAHLENKGATTMDQTGLAQKGGAVTSHVRIAADPDDIHTVRIGAAGASIILACDMLVTADGDALSKVRQGETKIILNTHEAQTGEFTRKPDWKIPTKTVVSSIRAMCGEDNLFTLDATRLATALLGDSIATNMFMLGYAWQMGLIPVGQDAILRAIELNGAAVKMNQKAFVWGRRAAFDLAAVQTIAFPKKENDDAGAHRVLSPTLDETIARRVASLTGYQSAGYAKKYSIFVGKIRAADEKINGKSGALTEAVARYLYKLMSYKDEYEVARLYTDGPFMAQVKQTFDGDFKIKFNLAPPLLSGRDDKGHLKKMEFGAWMLPVFRILAKLKPLRGTPLDIFGYTAERKMERRLIKDYKKTMEDILPRLTAENYAIAVEIASIPEHIRGYGHVKDDHLKKAKVLEAALLGKFNGIALENKQAA